MNEDLAYPRIRKAFEAPRNPFQFNSGRQFIHPNYRRMRYKSFNYEQMRIDNDVRRIVVVRGDITRLVSFFAQRLYSVLRAMSDNVYLHKDMDAALLNHELDGVHIIDTQSALVTVRDVVDYVSLFDKRFFDDTGLGIVTKNTPMYLIKDEIMKGRRQHSSPFEQMPSSDILTEMILGMEVNKPPLWRIEKYDFFDRSSS